MTHVRAAGYPVPRVHRVGVAPPGPWTSLGCFDHDATGVMAALADRFRAVFLDCFLAAAGRAEARVLLPTMVAYRLAHPRRSRSVRPAERESLHRLADGSRR